MNRIVLTGFALTLAVGIAGCAKGTSTVTSSYLEGHKETTIGKAFSTYFAEPKWELKQTANGTQFVEFTGKLQKDFGVKAGLRVLMQFTLYNNGTFKISYAAIKDVPADAVQQWGSNVGFVWGQAAAARDNGENMPTPALALLASSAAQGPFAALSSGTAAGHWDFIGHLTADPSDGNALVMDADGLALLLNEIYVG